MTGIVWRVLLRRPGLVAEAARLAAAAAPRGWFRRPPFLPIPDSGYLRWRMAVAYGRGDRKPTVREMEDFLVWRRRLRRTHIQ